ncbi:MAG: glucose-1-phosphate thymidylyltransferase [bacterium]|nr:glucose-1-phosphate thymidylyltransferase [bacterium]
MKAIIPTGGRGTRMRPLTFSSNKHFIPVANKPLIYYPIETIAKAGITEIGITYDPPYFDSVKNLLGDGSRWGVNFTFIAQEKPLGLPNIFQICEEYINGESFVMHLGDNIFTEGIQDFVDYFEKEKPNGLVAMVHHKENRRLGVPYFDEKGQMVKYVEKPENPPHDFAIPGLYFFDSNVFKCFSGENKIAPSARGELEISSPYQWLIDNGYRVDVLEYKGKWLDPGKFGDWIESNQYILDRMLEPLLESEPDDTSTIENRVHIGKNCSIINTHIRGPVTIGDNVTLNNAFVGPFTSISDNCVIEGSDIQNSVVLNNVKILNVPSSIDSSLIGAESEIGHSEGPTSTIKLFIGEKCQVHV